MINYQCIFLPDLIIYWWFIWSLCSRVVTSSSGQPRGSSMPIQAIQPLAPCKGQLLHGTPRPRSESKSKLLRGWHMMAFWAIFWWHVLQHLANSITTHVSWRPEGKWQTFWQQDGMPNKTLFVGSLLKMHLYIIMYIYILYPDHFQPSIHWFNGIQW